MKHSNISLSCDLWIGKVVEVIEIQSLLVLPRPGKNKTSGSESTVRLPYLTWSDHTSVAFVDPLAWDLESHQHVDWWNNDSSPRASVNQAHPPQFIIHPSKSLKSNCVARQKLLEDILKNEGQIWSDDMQW